MKIGIKVSKLMTVSIIILALMQLSMSYFLASAGETVHRLEQKTVLLESENATLEKEIGNLGSLSRISMEAGRLGFVRIGKTIALTSELPIALGSR